MKKIVLLLLGCILLPGCATKQLQKAHATYVQTMGPILINYSQQIVDNGFAEDDRLDSDILADRIALHKAALALIDEGNETTLEKFWASLGFGEDKEEEETDE